MVVRHIFLSPGHNYFGRHGQEPGGHPTTEVDEVECVAGFGLRGDRFFGYRPDYKGQITFFDAAVLEGLRAHLGVPGLPASVFRRNVITEGVDLNQLIGETFSIQGVTFVGTDECRPCYWMDRAAGAGAEHWLKGRGGLRARILTSGVLRRNAAVVPAQQQLGFQT